VFALIELALATAILGANADPTTCPAFPEDPAILIPATGTAVLGIDVDAFAKTSTGKVLLPSLRADLQLAEALEILDDCKLALERTYAVTLAREPGDGRLAVVQARGIGTDDTLACLANELRARSDGREPWTREMAGVGTSICHDSLALADGSRAWIINDYTLVWARASFIAPIQARLDGREPSELPAALRDELGRLDRGGQFWLAAQLDDADRKTLPGNWVANTESITAAIDLSKGLRAVFSLSAPDVATIAVLRELVLVGLSNLSDRLDEYGVEHRVRDRARVGIVGGVVAAELLLDEGELRAIEARIGERVLGRGPL
jgi:hypothetical protein